MEDAGPDMDCYVEFCKSDEGVKSGELSANCCIVCSAVNVCVNVYWWCVTATLNRELNLVS